MHRFKPFALLLIVSLLLFCTACQSKQPPPLQSFTAQASVTFGEASFTAALQQSCPGSLQLELSGLPELEGMVMQIEGGTSIIRYAGMELNLPTPSLPQAGFASVLGDVLLQLAQPESANARRIAGGWVLDGKAGHLAYTARLNDEGMLQSIAVPAAALEAVFTGFTPIASAE